MMAIESLKWLLLNTKPQLWEEVDTLEETERGEGGFGSSGVNAKNNN